MADAGKIILNQGDAPATPDSGKIAVYSKTDDKLYYKTDDGVEHEVTSSGGGGGATTLLELIDTPSAYDANKYLKSTASGTEWATVSGGGSGTTDHSALTNLDYASAGHTGFQPAGDYATDTELSTASGVLQTQIDTNTSNISTNTTRFTDMDEPHGFVDRVATLSFDNGTRTLTITGNHDIYIHGTKHSKTTDSIAIADTDGMHFIYYNSAGTLTQGTTAWTIGTDVPMAYVLWDATNNKGLLGEERHGIRMDSGTHKYLHDTQGARYDSGLAMGSYSEDLDMDVALEVSFEAGDFHDEDIEHTIAAKSAPAQIPVFYREGSGGPWRWDTAYDLPFKGVTQIQYNLNTAGTWSQANVSNQFYVAYWMIATNSESGYEIISVQGQRQDASLDGAIINNSIDSIGFGDFPVPEIVVLYRVILHYKSNYGGTLKAMIADVTDFRTSSAFGNGYVPTDHGSLTGLRDDDHVQYLLRIDYAVSSGTLQSQIDTNVSNIDTNGINLATHSGTANIHFLATDVDHTTIQNTHNLTTDIDHDQLTNYEADEHFTEASIDHGNIQGLSDDDHPQYHNNTRGDLRYYTQAQVDTLIQSATYSGTGLRGSTNIGNATDTVNITFGETVSGTDYYPNISIENTTDANPAQFGYTVTAKTTTGFTLLLSGDTDSANYKVNWRIGNDAINTGGGGSGINAVVDDTSPSLGGGLDMNGFNIEGVTPTEMMTLSGTTSNIQTQLNGKIENVVEDTSPQLGGNLDMQDYKIDLNASPSTNLSGNGIKIDGTAGSAIDLASRVLYVNSSGKWEEADADASTTMPAIGISMNSASTDGAVSVLLQGVVRNDGWAFTPGDVLYVSNTPGYVTATKPSGSGDQVQRIGVALTSTIIYFNPDLTVIEVA